MHRSRSQRPGRGLLAFLAVLLVSCAPPPVLHQGSVAPQPESQLQDKAIVVLAVDLREQTSLRDLSQLGDVLFRKVDENYATRPANDFDFGYRGSLGADWHAQFGAEDENRLPHLYAVAPGRYVIEKINIGSNPTTVGAGYDPATNGATIGAFAVQAGEVVNLGRLVVHMHWYEGLFYAETFDNSDQVRRLIADKYPALASKMQTRLLMVAPKIRFGLGPPRS